ncbi:hypothetical protein [Mycolicibacterium murale]|nr:hypothetical protein [Mycolicibacterium murale]
MTRATPRAASISSDEGYTEGGQYLLYIRPSAPLLILLPHNSIGALHWTSPHRRCGNARWGYRSATYAEQAQGLFDLAHDTVRAAFRDSVAATLGSIWATRPTTSDSARPLLMWMAELRRQFGCSVEECGAVLSDIEVIDPEAVARCRATLTTWLRDTA